ncbi:MAG TPA: glycosyltransferase [Polyangiaceae bacterium]|nr:glycosyltransferase [Polyangiaceae bacterium]
MSSAPRLSVVSPMYNSGKYLALTIESILAQTMGSLELILSDDGSTDDSLKIADEYAAKDPRVKVLRNQHHGIVATRNAGLLATDPRSEFITFFDSDDLWAENAAETLMRALENNPQAPAVHCVCRCVDSNGVRYPLDDHPENIRNRRAVIGDKIVPIPRSAATSFGALLIENYVTTPGTSMIRRSALESVGKFAADTEPCDDWDINLRLARLGDFVFVDEILLNWRRHSLAISNVSTRWRTAYVNTRQRTITAPENTPEQRSLARTALRSEIIGLQKQAFHEILRGGFKTGPKKLARSLLLGSVYVGVRGSRAT